MEVDNMAQKQPELEIGRIEPGSDRYPIRESRYFGRIGLSNPLSDRISDSRSDRLEIHRIVLGQEPRDIGSDVGRINLETGLSDYPIIR
jgi:hypothetical protein